MTGVSPTAVADAARYLPSWFSFRQRYDRVPGVQVALWHDDKIVLSTAHGQADVETGSPLTDQHLFRIASHSKMFTATAIMQLVESGPLRLDDPISQWLSFLDESALMSVTIRELLAHGGGVVRDGWDGDFWQLFRPFPAVGELRQISIDDASVLPRNERFKYSNIGYSLLGQVIEAVSGLPYRDYVRDHVVAVLGLNDTGPDLEPDRAGEYATGYSALSYADRRIPIEHIGTGAMAAATGFYSTASDTVAFASAHYHGDDRLVNESSKRLMQRTEWKVEGADTSYGLGLSIVDIGHRRMFGHGGGYPGHITRTLFDPVHRLAVSVFTNAIDGRADDMARCAVRFVDLAQRGVEERGSAGAAADLSRFRGRFADLWSVWDVVDLGGRLYEIDPTAADPTAEPHHLEVVDERTLRVVKAPGYASHGERLVYERAEDGSVASVRGGSGVTAYPIDRFTRAVTGRDRVSLSVPLKPMK